MSYDPKAIANEFLDIAHQRGQTLTPMKLQKLVYFAHGWNLGVNGEPLINEPVEAWQFGPVVPSLYHEFKGYGSAPIQNKARYGRPPRVAKLEDASGDEDHEMTRHILDWVWRKYSKFTPSQLSTMTHETGSPWHQTWEEMGQYYVMGVDIPEERIRDYFAAEFEKSNSHA